MDDLMQHIENNIVLDVNGCWIWQRAKKKPPSLPYGLMCIDGKMQRVHKLVYMLTVGEIPKGKNVLHQCDNASCCNPKHLFLGSQNQNMQDRMLKGRAPKGEKHSLAVLTEEQALLILNRIAIGANRELIQEEYRISRQTLDDLITGRRWKHLPRPEPIDILW